MQKKTPNNVIAKEPKATAAISTVILKNTFIFLGTSPRRLRQSKTMKYYWVYILTNINNTVLYAGVTNNLERRIAEHKNKKGSSFTSKYNVTRLVFYERFNRICNAIAAEKKIKAGSRAKKIEIIEAMNPNWQDLYNQKIASRSLS